MGNAGARAQHVVRSPQVRRTHRTIQLVFFDAAAQRVEEPVLEVTLQLRGVVIVRALDRFVFSVHRVPVGATLVFIVKAEHAGEVRGKCVIRLRVQRIPV